MSDLCLDLACIQHLLAPKEVTTTRHLQLYIQTSPVQCSFTSARANYTVLIHYTMQHIDSRIPLAVSDSLDAVAAPAPSNGRSPLSAGLWS